jgi:hypothetical protein
MHRRAFLSLLNRRLAVASLVNREYDTPLTGQSIDVRLPERYRR